MTNDNKYLIGRVTNHTGAKTLDKTRRAKLEVGLRAGLVEVEEPP